MKLIITAEGAGLDSAPSPTFGRCPFFVAIDTESGQEQALPNPAASAGGGAGVQAAQYVVGQGADAVLTGRVGPNAMEVLESAGVPVFELSGATVQQALDRYLAGDLDELTDATPARRGGGRGRGMRRRHRGNW